MKIRCKLLGCYVTDVPACGRCGADLYSYEFVQSGGLEPVFRLARTIRDVVSLRHFRRENCGRFLSLLRLLKEWKQSRKLGNVTSVKFCSQACDNAWFPF